MCNLQALGITYTRNLFCKIDPNLEMFTVTDVSVVATIGKVLEFQNWSKSYKYFYARKSTQQALH
jgi:hypothetical protein